MALGSGAGFGHTDERLCIPCNGVRGNLRASAELSGKRRDVRSERGRSEQGRGTQQAQQGADAEHVDDLQEEENGSQDGYHGSELVQGKGPDAQPGRRRQTAGSEKSGHHQRHDDADPDVEQAEGCPQVPAAANGERQDAARPASPARPIPPQRRAAQTAPQPHEPRLPVRRRAAALRLPQRRRSSCSTWGWFILFSVPTSSQPEGGCAVRAQAPPQRRRKRFAFSDSLVNASRTDYRFTPAAGAPGLTVYRIITPFHGGPL